jgi:hypothetical protein
VTGFDVRRSHRINSTSEDAKTDGLFTDRPATPTATGGTIWPEVRRPLGDSVEPVAGFHGKRIIAVRAVSGAAQRAVAIHRNELARPAVAGLDHQKPFGVAHCRAQEGELLGDKDITEQALQRMIGVDGRGSRYFDEPADDLGCAPGPWWMWSRVSRRSSGSGSAAVMVRVPAWISMVR